MSCGCKQKAQNDRIQTKKEIKNTLKPCDKVPKTIIFK